MLFTDIGWPLECFRAASEGSTKQLQRDWKVSACMEDGKRRASRRRSACSHAANGDDVLVVRGWEAGYVLYEPHPDAIWTHFSALLMV